MHRSRPGVCAGGRGVPRPGVCAGGRWVHRPGVCTGGKGCFRPGECVWGAGGARKRMGLYTLKGGVNVCMVVRLWCGTRLLYAMHYGPYVTPCITDPTLCHVTDPTLCHALQMGWDGMGQMRNEATLCHPLQLSPPPRSPSLTKIKVQVQVQACITDPPHMRPQPCPYLGCLLLVVEPGHHAGRVEAQLFQ